MDANEKRRWDVEGARIFSLDRCIKCLSVLNLGEKTMCTVVLRGKGEARKTERDA